MSESKPQKQNPKKRSRQHSHAPSPSILDLEGDEAGEAGAMSEMSELDEPTHTWALHGFPALKVMHYMICKQFVRKPMQFEFGEQYMVNPMKWMKRFRPEIPIYVHWGGFDFVMIFDKGVEETGYKLVLSHLAPPEKVEQLIKESVEFYEKCTAPTTLSQTFRFLEVEDTDDSSKWKTIKCESPTPFVNMKDVFFGSKDIKTQLERDFARCNSGRHIHGSKKRFVGQITGPAHVGKTTCIQALATKYDKSIVNMTVFDIHDVHPFEILDIIKKYDCEKTIFVLHNFFKTTPKRKDKPLLELILCGEFTPLNFNLFITEVVPKTFEKCLTGKYELLPITTTNTPTIVEEIVKCVLRKRKAMEHCEEVTKLAADFSSILPGRLITATAHYERDKKDVFIELLKDDVDDLHYIS